MSKLNKAVVVATKRASALELTEGAAGLAENVVVISLDGMECAVNAPKAYCLELAGRSVVMAGTTVSEYISREAPDLVITEQTRDGRLLAAKIATANNSSVLSDSAELWIEDGKVFSRRQVYGGKGFKTEYALGGLAVACVGYSVFASGEDAPATEIIAGELLPENSIEFISRTDKEVQSVNLGAARKIVGVGRGIGDGSLLGQIEEFAAAIGAEMACTRPVAEEERLMPKERYVGVTGSTIKPELYIALGISGAIQHTAGVNSSGTIIAVNKDKDAPIFKQCDYGIVGDMFETLKAISELIK